MQKTGRCLQKRYRNKQSLRAVSSFELKRWKTITTTTDSNKTQSKAEQWTGDQTQWPACYIAFREENKKDSFLNCWIHNQCDLYCLYHLYNHDSLPGSTLSHDNKASHNLWSPITPRPHPSKPGSVWLTMFQPHRAHLCSPNNTACSYIRAFAHVWPFYRPFPLPLDLAVLSSNYPLSTRIVWLPINYCPTLPIPYTIWFYFVHVT